MLREDLSVEAVFKLRPDQRQSPSAWVWGRALQTRGAESHAPVEGGGLGTLKN